MFTFILKFNTYEVYYLFLITWKRLFYVHNIAISFHVPVNFILLEENGIFNELCD